MSKMIKQIIDKLVKEIPKIFKIKISDYNNGIEINFTDKNGELYEDTIWVGKAGDFLIDEDREIFADVIENDELIISVDFWLKSFTKMTDEHIEKIKELVNKYATEYNLTKFYSYGMDDGGLVLFKDEIAIRSYYYSRGMTEVDPSWAPKSEEKYWNYVKDIISINEKIEN